MGQSLPSSCKRMNLLMNVVTISQKFFLKKSSTKLTYILAEESHLPSAEYTAQQERHCLKNDHYYDGDI